MYLTAGRPYFSVNENFTGLTKALYVFNNEHCPIETQVQENILGNVLIFRKS
jgi:hypothetical protein